jgi:hypothetical protein
MIDSGLSIRAYCSFAYYTLAFFRMGMWESASFQRAEFYPKRTTPKGHGKANNSGQMTTAIFAFVLGLVNLQAAAPHTKQYAANNK